MLLPVIKVSMPSPQTDLKNGPMWVESETRHGFRKQWKMNNRVKLYKGSRSQGCSPERQTRMEIRCTSSPHLSDRDRPPLPPYKMNFLEHNGGKEGKYLSSHLDQGVITSSRSVPSLNNIFSTPRDLDLNASSPACFFKNRKIQVDLKKHHVSSESVFENHQRIADGRHAQRQRRIIGRSTEQLFVPPLDFPPHISQLNVPGLVPLSSSSRSASLNALSFSSNLGLI